MINNDSQSAKRPFYLGMRKTEWKIAIQSELNGKKGGLNLIELQAL